MSGIKAQLLLIKKSGLKTSVLYHFFHIILKFLKSCYDLKD